MIEAAKEAVPGLCLDCVEAELDQGTDCQASHR